MTDEHPTEVDDSLLSLIAPRGSFYCRRVGSVDDRRGGADRRGRGRGRTLVRRQRKPDALLETSLAQEGAKEIRLLNRTFGRAKGIADEFGGPIRALPWEQRHDALEGAAMVVNTTSCGMVGQPLLDISLDKLPKTALAADIIYIPLETPFLAAARKRGNRTVNGLGMLLNQGRPAWKAWFGIEPDVTAELRAMIERTI